jgi:hypothetical protein
MDQRNVNALMQPSPERSGVHGCGHEAELKSLLAEVKRLTAQLATTNADLEECRAQRLELEAEVARGKDIAADPDTADILQSVANLCASEARRWESHHPKTADHWSRAAIIVGAEGLAAKVLQDRLATVEQALNHATSWRWAQWEVDAAAVEGERLKLRDDLTAAEQANAALRAEVDRLTTRLEIDPRLPNWDGIACRDETIARLDQSLATLRPIVEAAERVAEHRQHLHYGAGGFHVVLDVMMALVKALAARKEG